MSLSGDASTGTIHTGAGPHIQLACTVDVSRSPPKQERAEICELALLGGPQKRRRNFEDEAREIKQLPWMTGAPRPRAISERCRHPRAGQPKKARATLACRRYSVYPKHLPHVLPVPSRSALCAEETGRAWPASVINFLAASSWGPFLTIPSCWSELFSSFPSSSLLPFFFSPLHLGACQSPERNSPSSSSPSKLSSPRQSS